MAASPINLGRLERVDPREVWNSESSDFTPWLAQQENLGTLGETIGIDLELEAQEKDVGPFRADILCKDTVTGHWVLVENQLEKTDHTHLGQLPTYAAGLQAVTIIWIAVKFTEEHRAALDWLNEITDETVNFFGLEVELWRIGDSHVAPKFNIACQPNHWEKELLSRERLTRRAKADFIVGYWREFKRVVRANSADLPIPRASDQAVIYMPTELPGFVFRFAFNTFRKNLEVSVITKGTRATPLLRMLTKKKPDIERELGIPERLYWPEINEVEDEPTYSIGIVQPADPENREDWPTQHTWFMERLLAFRRVFQPLIDSVLADKDFETRSP